MRIPVRSKILQSVVQSFAVCLCCLLLTAYWFLSYEGSDFGWRRGDEALAFIQKELSQTVFKDKQR